MAAWNYRLSMKSIKILFENPIKMSLAHQNSNNRIEFSSIPLKFHQFFIFSLFPVKKPEIKDKGGLLNGTSCLKKQKFKQKTKS